MQLPSSFYSISKKDEKSSLTLMFTLLNITTTTRVLALWLCLYKLHIAIHKHCLLNTFDRIPFINELDDYRLPAN